MKQLILMQILLLMTILNLLNIRLNYKKIQLFSPLQIMLMELYLTKKSKSGKVKKVKVKMEKCLSNFWNSPDILLISSKFELKLIWTKYCVLTAAAADNNDASSNNTIFTIKDTKLCVSFVTLSARDN